LIADKAFTKVSSPLAGQKTVVEIGMVIFQDPAIVLLDEPTAGMTSDEIVPQVRLKSSLGSVRCGN